MGEEKSNSIANRSVKEYTNRKKRLMIVSLNASNFYEFMLNVHSYCKCYKGVDINSVNVYIKPCYIYAR